MAEATTQAKSLEPPWRVAVDVGGTFTDLVLADGAGQVAVVKVPSTPEDPAEGVIAALSRAAEAMALALPDFLRHCSLFVHGSTVGTNILVEGKGARVGLLVTRGFRDSLEIRRGIRENAWDHRAPYAPVLVPRFLRLPVSGRIDRRGDEVEPLSREDIAAAAAVFREEGVESVAICLFNAFLDETHERATEALLREISPDLWVCRSSAVAPVMGEYERSSTTVLNAAIAPRVVAYLETLNGRLAELGLPRPLLLVQNNGGAMTLESAAARPVSLLLSGPAAGAGALALYGASIGSGDLISMEIGGTSCDVMLVRDGQPELRESFALAGYHLALSSIDIHSVGAGGGTVAGVDDGGLLFVGPRGAGARPGPASYGFGGREPTVTDAQLILGRLRPGRFAGGALTLLAEPAREVMTQALAAPLDMSPEAAAVGLLRLLEQTLYQAVEQISGARGHDPRRFVLVAGGGAGPMFGAAIGRRLGCRFVYLPRHAGAFCALGMLCSPVRHAFSRVHLVRLEAAVCDDLRRGLSALRDQALAQLRRDGFDAAEITLSGEIDLRHPGQLGTISVPCPLEATPDPISLRAAFNAAHDRLYGHSQPNAALDTAALRVVGSAALPALQLAQAAPSATAPEPVARREVYFEASGGRLGGGSGQWVDTAVYSGADLRPGHRLAGPLLVEEATATIVAGPGDELSVDGADNFVIRFLDREARS